MTIKYNLELIFNYLKRYRVTYKQIKFISQPKEKHILERQFIIIVQYFLPHISYSVINKWLNDTIEEILLRFKNKYPEHSILSIPLEYFSFWRENNIADNFFLNEELEKLKNMLQIYIYTEINLYKLYKILAIPADYINYVSYFRLC